MQTMGAIILGALLLHIGVCEEDEKGGRWELLPLGWAQSSPVPSHAEQVIYISCYFHQQL